MIAAMDQWGPFRPDIDEAERRACLRGLRTIARLLAGPRAASLCQILAQAEIDATALEPACHALNALAGTDKRRILASYGVLTAPARPAPRLPETGGTGMKNPQHIATVPKNASEEVRISLSEFNGHELVDVRIWAAFDNGGERHATKKGVSLSRRHLSELIRALQAAEREASR